MTDVRLRILGGAAQNYGPDLDDRWLVAYRALTPQEADAIEGLNDPDVQVGATLSTAGPCPVMIRTTRDKDQALVLEAGEMHALYTQVMPKPFHKRLPDRKPNRPLTAFHVQMEKL